ncbi:MAG TPA: oligosaccharide flippase family protein [Patescibacteria group bacterium]|nr:oligosaccharide flippase family protein [Patescibacteria group bacterium]
MEELDIAAVTKRSIHGVIALVSRTFFVQIVNFVVNIFLTILFSPTTFGVYGVVLAVIAFLNYFSDIGLAGALIQKKDQITEKDLSTTFTLQQTLVISVSVIALLLSPVVGSFYRLPPSGILLFQALVVSFFLSSLKTIPSILLERYLRFEKLVIPEIVEILVFDTVVLVLAVKGFGISSFTYGVLARGIAGVITIYIISPWRPRFGFSKDVARKLLSFGIPFQMNSFLGLLKDDLLFAYIGKVLPFSQVGYIVFAQKWAFAPLRLIMDNIIRITFPSFARLQHDTKNLSIAVEKSLVALVSIIFPSLMGLVILGPYFISFLFTPRYLKWEPTLISLSLFAVNAAFSAISTPLTNALNAIGKIKVSLHLMIFWTIATWVLTPIAIWRFGFNGFALANAVIAFSVVYVVWLTKKYIPFSILPIFPSAFSTGVMGIILFFAAKYFVTNLLTTLLAIVFGAFIYFGILYFLSKDEMIEDVKTIKRQFAR